MVSLVEASLRHDRGFRHNGVQPDTIVGGE